MRELMGAILAGGLSTRMGRDKATMSIDAERAGPRMLDVVAEALRSVCDEIAVVHATPARMNEFLQSAGNEGYRNVADARPHAGPLGGIEAMLASGLASEYLVCPCDVPCITPDVLRQLLQHRDAPATVLRFAGSAVIEPLPARISAEALPTIRRLLDAEQRSVWRLMRELPAAIVEIDARHAAALQNINTPEDLSTL